MVKSKRLKNSKLAQLKRKQVETEEIAEEKEGFQKNDRLDSVMQRIDKFLYNDQNK